VSAAVVVVVLILGALVLLWRKQERILFQPPRLVEPPSVTGRVSYEAVDGQPLAGFLIGDPEKALGVLICFHGNADLAVWQLDWARAVEHRTGYAVFLAEYRGYMSLGGSPSYANTKLDSRAAYDHVRIAFGVDRQRVAFFGHSLGSAVATELAEIHPPSALLLQAPFSSARAMARLIVSPPVVLVWRAISRIHFDTQQTVAALDVPVSVAHGKRDRIVPFRMGISVFEAARKKGRLLIVSRAGHNDVADIGGEEYWAWMRSALRLPPTESPSPSYP
jgi:fermentation-respiration switch protein FrsA (DUF1100 family)